LPFDEEHRPFGIDGSGFYFVEALSGFDGKIAEKMFFSHRTREAIIKNIQAVRGAHESSTSLSIKLYI
jgi:hypothetical protein